MERVINLLDYLFLKYPNSNKLSYSRVMKLLYLIEWRNAITKFDKLTDIEWIATEYGPFYKSLRSIFTESSNFDVSVKFDENDKEQLLIKFFNNKKNVFLDDYSKEIVDFVIEHCKDYDWAELNNLVNSTFAVMNTNQGQIIDLVLLAKKYKNSHHP